MRTIWIVVRQPPHGPMVADKAFVSNANAQWHADQLVKAGGAFISLQTVELDEETP